jgi:Zn-dependent protease
MDLLAFLPVLLFSVVAHEVAHALVAKWEGDDTAYRLGRITLNPLPHLDLVGSFLVPLALYFLPGSFLFGWARPVPVNPANFRDRKWGDIRVSLAGIAVNLALALASVLLTAGLMLARPLLGTLGGAYAALHELLFYGLFINLILAFFNLLPVPPLDGSHVLYHLLPRGLAARYRAWGRYGMGLLMLVVFAFPGAFRLLLFPVEALISAAYRLLELLA